MIKYKEWQEATAASIQQNKEFPDDSDWEFYKTRIQGRVRQYLTWLTDALRDQPNNLVRKGFILQEIMDALGVTPQQAMTITSNIKHALQKKNSITKYAAWYLF